MGVCGSDGFWARKVPDKLLGFDLRDACREHDIDYSNPRLHKDKDTIDLAFLLHMRILILGYPRWRRPLYRAIAWTYYKAVRLFGGPAWRRARAKDVPHET